MADNSPEAVDAERFADALRAAREQAPDPAARVSCPDCGGILSEYLYGVARFICRHCRWQGIIERTGPAAGQRVTTLRPGKPSRRRDDQKED